MDLLGPKSLESLEGFGHVAFPGLEEVCPERRRVKDVVGTSKPRLEVGDGLPERFQGDARLEGGLVDGGGQLRHLRVGAVEAEG